MNNTFSGWEQEFKRDCPVEKFQEINHYWWLDCYDKIEKLILENIPLGKNSEILECGSGSGNSSLRLASKVKKVILLDNSKNALRCSQQLAGYYSVNNVEFIKGDIFHIPFSERGFDMCWNIGVIEHYEFIKAKEAVKEMLRVTKNSGYICIGVPNFKSFAIIKAKILSLPLLKQLTFWIKGYRLSDEKRYDVENLSKLLVAAAKESGVGLNDIYYSYVGSVLPIETPKSIFRKFDTLFSRIFSKYSFLIMVCAKVDRK